MSTSLSLADLTELGYVIEGWREFQQGSCLEYAYALLILRGDWQLGTNGDDHNEVQHFYAHDDTHAYDSAGRHPLPYLGIDPNEPASWADAEASIHDHGVPDPDKVRLALAHIKQHHPDWATDQ